MRKSLLVVLTLVLTVLSGTPRAQQTPAVFEAAAKALGAVDLNTLEIRGSGYTFALGQNVNPNAPWPRFNLTSFVSVVDFATPAIRQELVRTQAEQPPRGGGQQPLVGEQRQILVASGDYAWNVTGTSATPAPGALVERRLQVWLLPHGFVKAAEANKATARLRTTGGRKTTVVSFVAEGKHPVTGILNDQQLLERVETLIDNPVLGDMRVEITYADYKDFGGVKFPTRIVQRQGGHPTLELTVSDVKPNVPVDITVPDDVRQAPPPAVRVETEKLADGVFYLTGGSHHSVAVEFRDHVVVVEGPLNEARSEAVIGEIKKLIPGKPIRYLVNTHHHFDHAGGIRRYAAEGATIITHQLNRAFYEKAFAAPRTLNPDRLAQLKRTARFETVADRRTLSDGTRAMELYHVRGNLHHDGLLMAYLPKERLLIEADAFTPPPPDAPLPPSPNPFSVNLYETLQRLKLDVDRIVPLHGRVVPLEELRKAIGRTTN